MKKKLTLQDFSDYIVQHEGVEKSTADTFVRAFFDAVEEGLLEDKFVKIKGFGTFKLVSVSERESVNINTGERFQISGHTKVSFTPDNAMKELVNRPFAHFEAVDLNDDTDTREFEVIDEEMETDDEMATINEDTDAETDTDTDAEIDTNGEDATEEVGGSENETLESPSAPTHNEKTPLADATTQEADNAQTDDVNVTATEVVAPQSDDEAEHTNDNRLASAASSGNAPTTLENFTPTVAVETDETPRDETPISSPQTNHNEQSRGETSQHSPEESRTSAQSEIPAPKRNEVSDEDIVVTNPQPINHQSVTDENMGATSNTLGFTYNEVPMPRKRNWWKMIAITLGIAILLVASYFMGYYRILCPTCSDMFVEQHPQTPPAVVVQPKPAPQPVAAPSQPVAATNDSVPVRVNSLATAATEAKQPQPAVKNEQTATANAQSKVPEKKESTPEVKRPAVHRVQAGDNITRIAKKYYGSDKYAEKIIRYNNLKDANTIKVGMDLKLP